MTRAELARLLDHSVLKPEATESDIRAGADLVRSRANRILLRAAVLGENGGGCSRRRGCACRQRRRISARCDLPAVKMRAAVLAVADGAGEIDMVMNFGALKSGRATLVAAEIASIVRAVQGVPVKVILETAALSEDEKQARVSPRGRCRRSVREDVDRLPSERWRHGGGRTTPARRRWAGDGRQGFGRDSQPHRCARYAGCRSQSHRHVGERRDPRAVGEHSLAGRSPVGIVPISGRRRFHRKVADPGAGQLGTAIAPHRMHYRCQPVDQPARCSNDGVTAKRTYMDHGTAQWVGKRLTSPALAWC